MHSEVSPPSRSSPFRSSDRKVARKSRAGESGARKLPRAPHTELHVNSGIDAEDSTTAPATPAVPVLSLLCLPISGEPCFFSFTRRGNVPNKGGERARRGRNQPGFSLAAIPPPSTLRFHHRAGDSIYFLPPSRPHYPFVFTRGGAHRKSRGTRAPCPRRAI